MPPAQPRPAHTIGDAASDAYLKALDTQLRAAARNGARTLSEFVRAARGAFPTLVHERVKALRLSLSSEPADVSLPEQPRPELHPLDYEWYFSRPCAQRLAEMLSRQPGPILCLGAPTVAAALAVDGYPVVLIDRNPLVGARLVHVQDRIDLRAHDLDQPINAKHQFGVVFFDAPWYPEEEALWLWQSTRAVRPGGTIAFSLLPSLVRPTASRDRASILQESEMLGETSVAEAVLAYDTPLFEAEALVALGLPMLPTWRTSDLVVVRGLNGTAIQQPPRPACDDVWDTWVVGPQVVKLRRASHGGFDRPLSPVPGTANWIYTSVSRRDPSRALIDFWTSRNRVARVGDREAVAQALNALALEAEHNELAESSEARHSTAADVAALLAS